MQKKLLWLFGAMFLIPEILWSPVLNFYFEFFQSSRSSNVQPLRYNFLQNSDNLNYLKLVIFIQLIGLLLHTIFLIKNKKNINIKTINYLLLIISSFVVLFLVVFALYFATTFSINIM
jgi:hypothetical protein